MAAPRWLAERKIAHRGLHDFSRGPLENSLRAARAAIEQDFSIEADLRLSRDGEIFVFHDDALDRLTFRQGLFADFCAAQLAQICLRDGQTIPTLAEILAAVASATALILELKSDFSGDVALAEKTAALLQNYAGPVALKSFDAAPIAFLRERGAPWPLGMVAQSDYDDFENLSSQQREALRAFSHAEKTRPDFLSWRATDLPCAIPKLFREGGRPILAWTIRDAAAARRVAPHADQIIFEGFDPGA